MKLALLMIFYLGVFIFNPVSAATTGQYDFIDARMSEVLRRMSGYTADTMYVDHNGCFNYSNARVSDIAADSVTPLQSVLDEIQGEVQKYARHKPLSILLRDNYITDVGAESLCRFILSNSDIVEGLECLDLSNNRLTRAVIPSFIELLQKTKKLKVNLSINYLSADDLKTVSSDVLSRITCHSH